MNEGTNWETCRTVVVVLWRQQAVVKSIIRLQYEMSDWVTGLVASRGV